ncbi:FecR family protein [Butyricimonas virosa]|jgi:transmembrane sensor|uniref:FecR domain-containing protein n=3 Tax=Butyricimonas virosa TaxID=544645 RepID=A0ABX7H1W9_9BACT|nr:FecR family protein [Butyricimonas virosa]MCI6414416.1 FecR domain-containing protein [Butyricimonas virosa]MCI7292253.1 FecR domain-containing protein [Butyricimonas virosa]MDY6220339.1 FecR domain-containing protein [Butyricimonas virosa]QRO48400.1 FecR domain-containing protein [Butyricimonas virosa]UWO47243.1 FecR domain-containing protein [Butyricimonas virosa]
MDNDLGISIEEKVHRIKAYLDETMTPEEEVEFQRWLDTSVANRVLLDRIRDERILLNKIRFAERNDKGKGWDNIQKKIRKSPGIFIRFMRYVAVLVTIMLIGVAVYQVVDCRKEDDNGLLARKQPMSMKGGYRAYLELVTGERLVLDSTSNVTTRIEGAVIKAENKGTVIVDEQKTDSVTESVEYNRLVIPRGGEYKIVLADGSQVWINSQSVLEFPACFVGKERRVRLQGEAYFEVSKNVEKPFIVDMGNKEIRVLGTSFNVNDYDGKFVTTLVSGKVQVFVNDKDYVLTSSMQVRVEGDDVFVEEVDVREFTAWKDGLFVFKKQKLREVMDILSRWYDVDVFYQNLELQNLHFTGTIQRHSEISGMLKFLEKTDIVKFTLNGKTLIVSK